MPRLLPVKDADNVDLEELTKKDLVHVAETRYGLDLPSRMNKDEMIQAIEEAKKGRG